MTTMRAKEQQERSTGTNPVYRCSLCARPIRRNASYVDRGSQGGKRHHTCDTQTAAVSA